MARQVAVNATLGVVHSAVTPQGIGLISKVVHSFVYADAEEAAAGQNSSHGAEYGTSLVECPEGARAFDWNCVMLLMFVLVSSGSHCAESIMLSLLAQTSVWKFKVFGLASCCIYSRS